MGGGLAKQGQIERATSSGLYSLRLSSGDVATLRGFVVGSIVYGALDRGRGDVREQYFVPDDLKARLKKMEKTRRSLVEDEAISRVFFAFCAFGKRGNKAVLDGKQWAKMVKDCKLLNNKFTPLRADLLFAKVAQRGRTITKDQWLQSLELVVQESGTDIDFVRANLAVGAIDHIFHKRAHHFYSEKPRGSSTDNRVDNRVTLKFTREELETLQKWNETDAKFKVFMGTVIAATKARADMREKSAPLAALETGIGSEINSAAAAMPHTPKRGTKVRDVNDETLAEVFYAFCAYGKKRGGGFGGIQVSVLDGKQFTKMMKDCQILNKSFNIHGADILFSRVSRKDKTINLRTWMSALDLIGEEAKKDEDWVKRKLVGQGVPRSTVTKAEANRFYGDAREKNVAAANTLAPDKASENVTKEVLAELGAAHAAPNTKVLSMRPRNGCCPCGPHCPCGIGRSVSALVI